MGIKVLAHSDRTHTKGSYIDLNTSFCTPPIEIGHLNFTLSIVLLFHPLENRAAGYVCEQLHNASITTMNRVTQFSL